MLLLDVEKMHLMKKRQQMARLKRNVQNETIKSESKDKRKKKHKDI